MIVWCTQVIKIKSFQMNSPKDLRLSCISETKKKKCEIDIFIYGGCTKLIEMSALEHTHAQSKPEFSSSGTEKSLEKKRKECETSS